jgi:DNA mismatch repair protein MutL
MTNPPDISAAMNPRRVTVLPEHIANKIAAGEVIQRPESVVKELLENALDAGASSIEVIIKDGGKELIQIIDDGTGMDEQDAVASFLRHATSKIASYEDLEAIRTYGFRGEALASIAAVAQVTMKTRREADDVATVVKIAGEEPPTISLDARGRGTTVTVQNLFFNVPARRKFLKTTNTEFRHIHEIVQRTALAHPGLAFTFISDGDTIFRLKASTIDQRIIDLFGQRTFESLLPVEEQTDFLTVRGFIGKPAFGQKTRLSQFLYLNGRMISSRSIGYAVGSAYEHLLINGTYPFYLLFLEIDPHRIDVNVHPSKMEVKFDDEQGVNRFISALVRKSLGGAGAVPAMTFTEGYPGGGDLRLGFTQRQHAWGSGVAQDIGWTLPERSRVDAATGEIFPPLSGQTPTGHMPAGMQDLLAFPSLTTVLPGREGEMWLSEPPQLLWQLHNKYILSQIRHGVMIVDQHVAHERILYEKALERFANGLRTSQQLLFPVTVQLTAGDYAVLDDIFPHIERLGFDLKRFGKNTVVIEGVPPDVKAGHEQSILEEILALYKEYQRESPGEASDLVAKSFSCKSAIKAGDPLTEAEMRSLIDQLFGTKMPYVCPHGRPIVLRISTEELDRRFGRR